MRLTWDLVITQYTPRSTKKGSPCTWRRRPSKARLPQGKRENVCDGRVQGSRTDSCRWTDWGSAMGCCNSEMQESSFGSRWCCQTTPHCSRDVWKEQDSNLRHDQLIQDVVHHFKDQLCIYPLTAPVQKQKNDSQVCPSGWVGSHSFVTGLRTALLLRSLDQEILFKY